VAAESLSSGTLLVRHFFHNQFLTSSSSSSSDRFQLPVDLALISKRRARDVAALLALPQPADGAQPAKQGDSVVRTIFHVRGYTDTSGMSSLFRILRECMLNNSSIVFGG
jgi:hypothetical protein